jgi:hypothetical protein
LRSKGSDVVLDFIETQGRAATALISDLEVIPLAGFYIVGGAEANGSRERGAMVSQDITNVRWKEVCT